jgi:hypothetical protein
MIKFEFKQTNQKLTAHYRPPTLVANSSVGGTAQSEQTLPLPSDPAAMSSRMGATAQPPSSSS